MSPSDTFHAVQPSTLKIGSGGSAIKGIQDISIGGWSAPSLMFQIDDNTYKTYAGFEVVDIEPMSVTMRSAENADTNFNSPGALSDDLIATFDGKGDLSGGSPSDCTVTLANATIENFNVAPDGGRQAATFNAMAHSDDGTTDPIGYAFS